MLTYNLSFKKVMSSCSIEPEWQRNSNLWPTRVVNQYLDDILDGNPMAPILVFKDKELKKKVVIDGTVYFDRDLTMSDLEKIKQRKKELLEKQKEKKEDKKAEKPGRSS